MMRRASLALLGLVMGCGQLPALPDEAAERLPTELAFNGLWPTENGITSRECTIAGLTSSACISMDDV